MILGIGSSFSLLGKTFTTVSSASSIPGLGLLNIQIKLLQQEPTKVRGEVASGLPNFASILSRAQVEGYTIHSGDIIMDDGEKEFIKIISKGHGAFDGIISQTGRAMELMTWDI